MYSLHIFLFVYADNYEEKEEEAKRDYFSLVNEANIKERKVEELQAQILRLQGQLEQAIEDGNKEREDHQQEQERARQVLEEALRPQQEQHNQDLEEALRTQQEQHNQDLEEALRTQQEQHNQSLREALRTQQEQHYRSQEDYEEDDGIVSEVTEDLTPEPFAMAPPQATFQQGIEYPLDENRSNGQQHGEEGVESAREEGVRGFPQDPPQNQQQIQPQHQPQHQPQNQQQDPDQGSDQDPEGYVNLELFDEWRVHASELEEELNEKEEHLYNLQEELGRYKHQYRQLQV